MSFRDLTAYECLSLKTCRQGGDWSAGEYIEEGSDECICWSGSVGLGMLGEEEP